MFATILSVLASGVGLALKVWGFFKPKRPQPNVDLTRVRDAVEAEKKIDTSEEGVIHDPNNLDRPR